MRKKIVLDMGCERAVSNAADKAAAVFPIPVGAAARWWPEASNTCLQSSSIEDCPILSSSCAKNEGRSSDCPVSTSPVVVSNSQKVWLWPVTVSVGVNGQQAGGVESDPPPRGVAEEVCGVEFEKERAFFDLERSQ